MTSDGTATYYNAPVIGGSPASPNEGIAVAHDGSVWVTSLGHNAIYRVDPKDGTFTKFDISTPGSQPGQITRGPGGALWFTMFAAQKIGRITTQGVITEYAQKLIVSMGSLRTRTTRSGTRRWTGSDGSTRRRVACGRSPAGGVAD